MRSNPVTKPREANIVSRSESEPIRPRYTNAEWPVSQERMKPATGGEETGVCSHRGLSGVVGDGARWKDQPRNLGGPRCGFFDGSRTAHSSGEAGNDRGAKGLNVNVQL